MMRRTILMVALGVAVTVAAPAGAVISPRAQAPSATFTARQDPNDIDGRPDLRWIRTDLDLSAATVRIGAWHRLTERHDMMVLFDTRGTGGWEYVMDVFPGGKCVLYEIGDGDISEIGSRAAGRVSSNEVVCRIPRGWLGIEKSVGFAVRNAQSGVRSTDRAPDVGRYRGL